MSALAVLFTSASCGHCRQFRGEDGIPSDNKPFSRSFIFSLLDGVEELIEIHVSEISNTSPILEFNIYFKCSSSRNIKGKSYDEIMSQGGDSLARVAIHRMNKTWKIEASIDGYTNDYFTSVATDYFVYSLLPKKIIALRNDIKNKRPIETLNTSILTKNGVSYDKTQHQNYCNDPSAFDNFLFRKLYNFDWIMQNVMPSSIRSYELAYPTWCLISVEEWNRSIQENDQVYAVLVGNKTVRDENGKYSIVRYSRSQTIQDLVNSYHNGDVSLEYSDKKSKLQSWQN